MASLRRCLSSASIGSRRIASRTVVRGYATVQDVPATPVEDFDVVIVGGGPAGLALASSLAPLTTKNLIKVALVEASDLDKVRNWAPERDGDGSWFSNRVSSITNESRQFLSDIGAWRFVDETRTTPVEEMQVWDGLSDSRIEFFTTDNIDSTATTATKMSTMTENLNLQRGLLRHLDSLSPGSFTILDNTKVASIQPETDEPEAPIGSTPTSKPDGKTSAANSVTAASTASSSSSTAWPLIKTSTNRILRARLLVGADGPSSPVRTYSKIPTYGWSYNTRAIVATLQHDNDDSFGVSSLGASFPQTTTTTTAYQRFLPTGPIAYLPLGTSSHDTSSTSSSSSGRGRGSLVWSTTPELAEALLGSGPEVLTIMINAAFRLPEISMQHLNNFLLERWSETRAAAQGTNRGITAGEIWEEVRWREASHSIEPDSALSSIGSSSLASSPSGVKKGIPAPDVGLYPPLIRAIQPGSAASFPLRMSHASDYIGPRTVLIGDAAHTVHPLAGQGLNLGLGDAFSLSRTITNSFKFGGDLGVRTALAEYSRERYLVNHGMLSATDKLHKIYGTRLSGIVWARSVGLEVVNESTALKAALMGSAGAYKRSRYNNNESKSGSGAWELMATGSEVVSNMIDSGRGLLGVARSLLSR